MRKGKFESVSYENGIQNAGYLFKCRGQHSPFNQVASYLPHILKHPRDICSEKNINQLIN